MLGVFHFSLSLFLVFPTAGRADKIMIQKYRRKQYIHIHRCGAGLNYLICLPNPQTIEINSTLNTYYVSCACRLFNSIVFIYFTPFNCCLTEINLQQLIAQIESNVSYLYWKINDLARNRKKKKKKQKRKKNSNKHTQQLNLDALSLMSTRSGSVARQSAASKA